MIANIDTPQHHVGPYVIDAEIGRGAHGVVFQAHHVARPHSRVALKVVENRGELDRLLIEPELLSRLHHPGIVGLEDYFIDGDRLVVALEFIDGDDLTTYLDRRGVLSPAEVREFLRQMAIAVEQAHAAGVLHRDIKPSNILVEEREGQSPRFVLTDFGISRLAEGIQRTKHGGGTYLFMAPEQFRGRPEKQTDLWALGVVAYVLLTHEFPFTGNSVEDLSKEVFFTVPKPPRERLPTAADEVLERLIYDLLEKQIESRIATATELLSRISEPTVDVSAESASPQEKSVFEHELTYDRNLKLQALRHWRLFWISAVFVGGPYGFIPQVVLFGGVFLFFRGQTRSAASRNTIRTAIGLALMGLSTLTVYFMPGMVGRWLLANGWSTTVVGWIVGIGIVLNVLCGIIIPFVIGHHFVAARRCEREFKLRRSLVASSLQPDAYVELLRAFLEQSPADNRLYLRVIEALLAIGRADEAAIESQLLLANDPYDFGGSLLLAQSYFDLQLFSQALTVCEQYLAISGYCFEFDEMKSKCHTAMMELNSRPQV